VPEKEKTRATQRKTTHRLAMMTSSRGGTDGDTNSHNHRDLEGREREGEGRGREGGDQGQGGGEGSVVTSSRRIGVGVTGAAEETAMRKARARRESGAAGGEIRK